MKPRSPELQEDSLSSEPPGRQSEFLLYLSDHPTSLSRTLQGPPTTFIIDSTLLMGYTALHILAPTYLSNLISHYFLCCVHSIQVTHSFRLLLIHTNHSLPQGLCTYMPSALSYFGKKKAVLLRYNSHSTQFTHKCTIQCFFSIITGLYNNHHFQF